MNRWHRLSKLKRQYNPLCEECEKAGQTVVAAGVHHKQTISERPDLAFDMDNLQSLCAKCHARMERE